MGSERCEDSVFIIFPLSDGKEDTSNVKSINTVKNFFIIIFPSKI